MVETLKCLSKSIVHDCTSSRHVVHLGTKKNNIVLMTGKVVGNQKPYPVYEKPTKLLATTTIITNQPKTNIYIHIKHQQHQLANMKNLNIYPK